MDLEEDLWIYGDELNSTSEHDFEPDNFQLPSYFRTVAIVVLTVILIAIVISNSLLLHILRTFPIRMPSVPKFLIAHLAGLDLFSLFFIHALYETDKQYSWPVVGKILCATTEPVHGITSGVYAYTLVILAANTYRSATHSPPVSLSLVIKTAIALWFLGILALLPLSFGMTLWYAHLVGEVGMKYVCGFDWGQPWASVYILLICFVIYFIPAGILMFLCYKIGVTPEIRDDGFKAKKTVVVVGVTFICTTLPEKIFVAALHTTLLYREFAAQLDGPYYPISRELYAMLNWLRMMQKVSLLIILVWVDPHFREGFHDLFCPLKRFFPGGRRRRGSRILPVERTANLCEDQNS